MHLAHQLLLVGPGHTIGNSFLQYAVDAFYRYRAHELLFYRKSYYRKRAITATFELVRSIELAVVAIVGIFGKNALYAVKAFKYIFVLHDNDTIVVSEFIIK